MDVVIMAGDGRISVANSIKHVLDTKRKLSYSDTDRQLSTPRNVRLFTVQSGYSAFTVGQALGAKNPRTTRT